MAYSRSFWGAPSKTILRESFRSPSLPVFSLFPQFQPLENRSCWPILVMGNSIFEVHNGISFGTPGYIILSPPRKIRQEVPDGNNANDCPCFSHRKVPHTKLPHFILRIQKSLGCPNAIEGGCHDILHRGVL